MGWASYCVLNRKNVSAFSFVFLEATGISFKGCKDTAAVWRRLMVKL